MNRLVNQINGDFLPDNKTVKNNSKLSFETTLYLTKKKDEIACMCLRNIPKGRDVVYDKNNSDEFVKDVESAVMTINKHGTSEPRKKNVPR